MATAKPAIVGGFVLSGLALGVVAILLFGGTHLFSRSVHAVVYFRGSVAGLDVGAPVTFRGVRVGSVKSIAVNLNMKDLTARIPVYLDLNPSQISLDNSVPGEADPGFDRLLKAGLRAQLNMQSLITGQLGVDLDLRPDIAAAPLGSDPDIAEIPSIPSKLQTLEDEIAELPLKEIAENARQTLAAVQRLADEVTSRVGPLADNLGQTSAAARATLEDIDRLAAEGKKQLAVNGDALGRVLESSDRTVREAETLVTSLNEMTAPNSQIRGDLQAAIRDLAASASSLRGFTHEVERDPSAMLTGRTAH
ncbi:MAG TPA: MlaD family protein [Stellaceae bacterium]|nr:MlaD family protein [Stellaceae bacterium]